MLVDATPGWFYRMVPELCYFLLRVYAPSMVSCSSHRRLTIVIVVCSS